MSWLQRREDITTKCQRHGDILVTGDFNAHIQFSETSDSFIGKNPQGTCLAELLDNSDLYPVSCTSIHKGLRCSYQSVTTPSPLISYFIVVGALHRSLDGNASDLTVQLKLKDPSIMTPITMREAFAVSIAEYIKRVELISNYQSFTGHLVFTTWELCHSPTSGTSQAHRKSGGKGRPLLRTICSPYSVGWKMQHATLGQHAFPTL